MKINKIEDLEIWQTARKLCKYIYELTSIQPFMNDFKFRDQIRSSSGSVMDNIAEGYGRGGNREFINFISIAKGSNEEVRSQSYRAFDFNYINLEQLEELLEITDKISKQSNSLMQYLKKSDYKGPKFPR